ncbi:entericidin A/B family lipoprotein [uncultured Albimonas sp.]|uniref:entericidin A/B family lipoprotein n=1 Tax=uncultured Albimonas sp. TaxID=1331701 RepID=UPI0030ED1702|tara:strand:+ start:1712 stop:1882 length:171 start_codon:yes stop_codon:yes gene_type:complete
MIARKTLVALMAAGFVSTALAGCNTVEGAGRDIQAAGSGVSHVATESEEELEKATE